MQYDTFYARIFVTLSDFCSHKLNEISNICQRCFQCFIVNHCLYLLNFISFALNYINFMTSICLLFVVYNILIPIPLYLQLFLFFSHS